MNTIKEPLTGERLAKAAVNQILANPACWKQSEWHSECGTKHCFGGWCQLLSGKEQNKSTTLEDASAALRIYPGIANWIFAAERTLNDLYQFAANFAGYDRAGYDLAGYDRAGYDLAGYDRAGYDRAGYDRAGRDRDGKKFEPFILE